MAKNLLKAKSLVQKPEPIWVKFKDFSHISFVGSSAVCFGFDEQIFFLNYETKEEKVYLANSEENGDGVACLAGHSVFPLFAFAEIRKTPRIFVLTYPEFGKISVLKKEDPCPYLSICFSSTEHLIALTGAPKFLIQVWYWRSNEMLVERETGQTNRNQIIGCGDPLPPTVCQLSTLSAKLILWELHGTVKLCKLVDRRISLDSLRFEGPLRFTFALDGTLYIISSLGNIYHVYSSSGQCNQTFKWEGVLAGYQPCMTCIQGGILVAGPDGFLRQYRKIKGVWTEQWRSEGEEGFIGIEYYHAKEVSVGVTEKGLLYVIKATDESVQMTPLKEFNRAITHVSFLKPLDDFLVTFNEANLLVITKLRNGETVSELQMKPQSSFRAHPKLPYLMTGNDQGVMTLVNLVDVFSPRTETSFFLSSDAIQAMNYSPSGDFLVVLTEKSDIFIMKSAVGASLDVVQHFPAEDRYISPIFLESSIEVTLLAIILEPHSIMSGKKLFSISFGIESPEIYAQTEVSLPDSLSSLSNISGSDQTFHGAVHQKTLIKVMRLKGTEAQVDATVRTDHVCRELKISQNSQSFVSHGSDGTVCLFNAGTSRKMLTLNLHNRFHRGVCHAEVDTLSQYLVSFGHSGNVVCIKLNLSPVNVALEEEINASHQKWKKEVGAFETEGLVLSEELASKRWLDIQRLKSIQKEEELFQDERFSISSDFYSLKTRLRNLMDRNHKMPDAEKIELEAFNLDKEWTDIKATRAEDERKAEQSRMSTYVEAQKKVNEAIVSRCWDSMQVKGSQIRGIFSRIKVDNFPLPSQRKMGVPLSNVLLWRKLEVIASTGDCFLPWLPVEANDLERILSTDPEIKKTDLRAPNVLEDLATLTALTGTRSHTFISPLEFRCAQLDVVTIHQINLEKIVGDHDILRLREYFNRLFYELQQTKESEMTAVSNTNKRLRHIQSELQLLADLKNTNLSHEESIEDPHFSPEEQPETIVRVLDDEVSVTQYVSPSHAKIIEAAAMEQERVRLEMIADDFRDRALMQMMDGVLEHRWEDEIKKPVWKPACMLEKDQRDYDEADFRAVKDYHRRVKQNLLERDKYHDLLCEEKDQMKILLRSRITNFNYKVAKLELLKMAVEACIHEEEIRMLKVASFSYQRIAFERQEAAIQTEVEGVRRQLSYLSETLGEIQEKITEFKANYETLNTKDRLLDKQFKSNFAEVAPIAVVDPAYKIFRRRPKYQIRAWATVPILLDLAKRIITRKTHEGGALLLPIECVEYMNLLDQMDTFVSGAIGIDQNVWVILCRMRRAKIESEFKLKALGLQLAEAETTANGFSREIHHKRNYLSTLESKLESLVESKLREAMNRQIQLVMRRGLIEIELHGRAENFRDCVLIHKQDIEDINGVIKKAGMKKLKAMTNAAVFRRKIITKEWEHKVLRLTVRDMKNFVDVVEKSKITKEVQMWLKRKELGWEDNLGESAIETDIQNTITNQERLLTEAVSMLEECERRIVQGRRRNNHLDRNIQSLNLDIAENGMHRNINFEEEQHRSTEERMEYMAERSRLVRKLQEQHSHILELSTMLELQKLRTFPTLTVPGSNRMRSGY